MITETNVSYLIESVRLLFGDFSTPYQYSDIVYKTALVNAVKLLQKKWGNKYLIDDNNNVVRNTDVTYDEEAPPIIQQIDETPIVLQAVIVLHQLRISSSATSFSNWSTDDLSFSNVASSNIQKELYLKAVAALEEYFKSSLGKPLKSYLPTRIL